MKSGFCLMKRSTADRLVKSMFMITKKKAPNLCARPKKQRHSCTTVYSTGRTHMYAASLAR